MECRMDMEKTVPDRISVAMCTYNGATYLWQQLDSINRQTCVPDELIICDDCSNDKTVEIIESFIREASFSVKLFVNTENLGSTKNFEKAIKLCSGSIILLADQDDIWELNKVNTIKSIFCTQPQVGVVFSDAEIIDDASDRMNYTLWDYLHFNKNEQNLFLLDAEAIISLLTRKNVVTGATMSFRSSFRESFLPIPELWIHDAWITILLANYTKIQLIDQKLVMYRQHCQQQIGAKKSSVYSEISSIRSDKHDNYQRKTNVFRILLSAMDGNDIFSNGVKSIIQSKIEHLEKRSTIKNKDSLLQLSSILIELLNGGYHKYSSGWKSFIKDLIA